ncbi:c-type cytochrome [Thiorhodovibrio frisius]|uniref:Cytochrome c n=1 Tax=Thiorhodovibrio frisius TaxID=631362 RepID=H8Z395_9GAMM|nr:c-type cytochrome [Thiorhodovibrio frisius]EIC21803.1 cytochrome c [Thiorhodovibrio frisius]WPL21773.1 cytochrome c oxidase, cbb3-type, subunit III [Thiorhodovibrio frisius]
MVRLVSFLLLMMLTGAARAQASEFHVPPSVYDIPEGHDGRLIELGRKVFSDTQSYASRYVGNGLNCSNCHLNEGRKPYSAPLWGAYGRYPQYRNKNKRVVSFGERIQDCFRYSMNGQAPTLDSQEVKAITAYAHWLSYEVPIGVTLAGAGFVSVEPVQAPSAARGELVFQQQCVICHGVDGLGRKRADGMYQFPPLWGADSFNRGAGMQRVPTCAAFVKANMPLGKGFSLSDTQAFDVCEFMHQQGRPRDPRDSFWSNFFGG